jgi:hypothetical protein
MTWEELTGGADNATVKYNISNPSVKEEYRQLGIMLNAAGCLKSSAVGTVFNLDYEEAVKAFQEKIGIRPITGIIDIYTFAELKTQVGDKIMAAKDSKNTTEPNSPLEKSYDGTPKHTPFFNSNNSQKLRNTNLEIRIDFGANHPLNKTIKHVFLRSLGVDIDASGNPLYKVYEFIGQDVEENDVTDLTKVNEDGTTSKVKQTVNN